MKRALIIIISIILVISLLVIYMIFCHWTNKQPVISGENMDWMKEIDDNLLLSDFCIPGTHDSGSVLTGGIHSIAQNQKLTIDNQLKIGCRFFDIRLGETKGVLTVYHGFVNIFTKFTDIMELFRNYLSNHPSETILLCIKKDNGDTITNKVEAILNENSDIMYMGNSIPILKDVRGKIVLFRRFESNNNIGINLYDGFKDNCTFDIINEQSIHIQDFYNFESRKRIQHELVAINDCLEYSKTKSNGEMVINFSSGYYPIIPGTPIPEIKYVAKEIHKFLIDYFNNNTNIKSIILIDFADENLISKMINQNF